MSIIDKIDLVVQRRAEFTKATYERLDKLLARYAAAPDKLERAAAKHDSALDREEAGYAQLDQAIDRLSNEDPLEKSS